MSFSPFMYSNPRPRHFESDGVISSLQIQSLADGRPFQLARPSTTEQDHSRKDPARFGGVTSGRATLRHVEYTVGSYSYPPPQP